MKRFLSQPASWFFGAAALGALTFAWLWATSPAPAQVPSQEEQNATDQIPDGQRSGERQGNAEEPGVQDGAGDRRGGRGAQRGGRGGRRGGRRGQRGGGFPLGPPEPPYVPLPRIETTGPIPSDAIVVFDGSSTEMLVGPDGSPVTWPVIDGVLYCDTQSNQRQQGLWTRLHFGAAQVHAEVFVPTTGRNGQDAGNSGFYFHGLIEVQILDTYDNRTSPITGVGAIYNIHPPLVNAARPPDSWHVFDFIYHPPKRDASGQPIEAGSMTVLLNGVLVQDHAPILNHVSVYAPLNNQGTDYSRALRENVLATEVGPLQLQYHDSPVGFRNIWVRPLDDRAFVFDISAPLPQRASPPDASGGAAPAGPEAAAQESAAPEAAGTPPGAPQRP
jgi:hypothetical protein